MSRTVLTIATGKLLYLDMAVNLARSFYYWNKGENISFYLATDMPSHLPGDVSAYINIIALKEGEFGAGFAPKLHLDKFAPDGQTLFIDSDCLIYGQLSSVFDAFKGHAVSVIGNYIKDGEWFGDVSAVCKKFNLSQLPKFNGGIYYLENGAMAGRVYQKARELEALYDDIGFVRLRGRPNDEVLMALAMALNGQTVLGDDGTIMSDPQACQGTCQLDVIQGKTSLINPLYPHKLHQNWYPFHKVSPLIVHFLGACTHHYSYRLDTYKLQKVANNQLNFWSSACGLLLIECPERFKEFLKDILRPVFHKVFGTRRIKESERI